MRVMHKAYDILLMNLKSIQIQTKIATILARDPSTICPNNMIRYQNVSKCKSQMLQSKLKILVNVYIDKGLTVVRSQNYKTNWE